jgi:hypothetical protein
MARKRTGDHLRVLNGHRTETGNEHKDNKAKNVADPMYIGGLPDLRNSAKSSGGVYDFASWKK